uniref:Kinesin-like protein n=1 Tax=Eutreptiella gymnastica TaxID=73025 RepID=A0A7S4GKI5_9EUGL
MVSLIVDAPTAREALVALKDPLKSASALIQLKAMSILGALVKNTGHHFHVELATKKWMDRLIKMVRTTRDSRVREKVLQLMVDWEQMFQLQLQLDEFSIALHRLKAKGVELPPPSEKGTRRSHRRQKSGDTTVNCSTGAERTLTRKESTKIPQTAQLTAIEILMTNIQADMSNLELGIQRPEILQHEVADECRQHLQKIQVVLSTDLPDQAMYEFINMSDQLHELLGLYDALYTDGTAAELALDREVSELKKLDAQIRDEDEAIAKKETEMAELQASLKAAQQELRLAQDETRQRSLRAPHNEKQKAMYAKMTQVVSNCVNVKQAASDLKSRMMDELEKMKQENAKFQVELEDSLMEFPVLMEKARTGESKAFLTLKKLYTIEVNTRKQLYNKLQELRGNIRVYCRVRPLSEKERLQHSENMMQYPGEGEIVVKDGAKQRAFEFDLVYNDGTTQEEVFEDTKPLINCVVDGYKVCIFAYGQTGSGKTYTMAGPHNNPGINRRALSRLFELVAERKDVEKSIVSVSVLEIYNENIRDLLASKVDDTVKYEIKTHPQDGQYVENLTSFPVQSLSDIDAYMAKAEKNRSSGRTNMNEHSSRSHMVLYVVVRTTNLQSGVVTVGKVSLVDLAGSERVGKSGATGDRMKEAQCINKSLSALGDVISSLSKNDSHIPYRNSKLTHLLKDSLGGNSKCLMFVNVSPASWNANETINSLQFAFRARGVVIGTAKKNVVPS